MEGYLIGLKELRPFLPKLHVYDAIPEPLEGEADAGDDVVGARHPQRAIGLEDAPRFSEPPQVEPMILLEAPSS
jgi:hypothetical protein